MLIRLKRWWRELFARENRLWVTQVVASIAAVLLALAGSWGAYFVPEGTFPDLERETLDGLLTVIASSMLAVTTFSLSTMVGAFGAAASSVTPRARPLLMADDGTRTAIAAFLSAFIYAVVAKIALGIGYYGTNGRFILFLGTLAVLAWLLITLVRWVRTLSSLGSMDNTLQKVEDVARDALEAHWRDPWLGARPGLPEHEGDPLGEPIYASDTGYLKALDMAELQACAVAAGRDVHVRVRPGAMVWPGAVVARVGPRSSRDTEDADGADGADVGLDELSRRVRDGMVIGATRSFDQDPRFGLIVLSESGQRALSPAVNDPGTAIDVMNRLVRVLIDSQRADDDEKASPTAEVRYERLSLVPLDEAALVTDAFQPIARDGAGHVEVGIRMQKLLAMLAMASRSGAVSRAARAQAEQARDYATATLQHEHERQAVRAQHAEPSI
ncbi:DUF2254 domain-containing protein [Ottowia flava]|uniref:DUF2254 domain-containing protein n=1 Tax=Ottowia flava TaxID=2675430 RepID=A0ABW4KQZ4_9BURK|nr:DUF2254 domain-containing protein [Ottowia sp. GY511]